MTALTAEKIEVLKGRLDPGLGRELQRSAELGFLGGMPVDDQVDHALGFVALVEDALGGPPRAVVDLGTGGGVPGLVVACCWPDARTVLLDGSERRVEFLAEATSHLEGCRGAEAVLGRAEELGHRDDLREVFDVVTSRSFGPPSATAECASSFLADGGLLVVSEPPDPVEDDRWPVEGLARCGLERVGQASVAGRYGYEVIRKRGVLEERLPRRVGIPVKRPLF